MESDLHNYERLIMINTEDRTDIMNRAAAIYIMPVKTLLLYILLYYMWLRLH